MKSLSVLKKIAEKEVTLRVRVWIEMDMEAVQGTQNPVTLRVRVWIEIYFGLYQFLSVDVTLRVRVWIEIFCSSSSARNSACHPPCEGVD